MSFEEGLERVEKTKEECQIMWDTPAVAGCLCMHAACVMPTYMYFVAFKRTHVPHVFLQTRGPHVSRRIVRMFSSTWSLTSVSRHNHWVMRWPRASHKHPDLRCASPKSQMSQLCQVWSQQDHDRWRSYTELTNPSFVWEHILQFANQSNVVFQECGLSRKYHLYFRRHRCELPHIPGRTVTVTRRKGVWNSNSVSGSDHTRQHPVFKLSPQLVHWDLCVRIFVPVCFCDTVKFYCKNNV